MLHKNIKAKENPEREIGDNQSTKANEQATSSDRGIGLSILERRDLFAMLENSVLSAVSLEA